MLLDFPGQTTVGHLCGYPFEAGADALTTGYGTSVDVWGVGCLALEMITMKFLHKTEGMLAMKVR